MAGLQGPAQEPTASAMPYMMEERFSSVCDPGLQQELPRPAGPEGKPRPRSATAITRSRPQAAPGTRQFREKGCLLLRCDCALPLPRQSDLACSDRLFDFQRSPLLEGWVGSDARSLMEAVSKCTDKPARMQGTAQEMPYKAS